MTSQPFKILTIDGGGIRGLFPASFLSHIEEHTDKRIVDHFDLVVGTSTGAIIALGLAAGMPAQEILKFYQRLGKEVFAQPRDRFTQWFKPKYDNKRLVAELRAVFGEKVLNDFEVGVAVASYEVVAGTPRVIKNDHHKDLHWGGGLQAWKVAAASSAAPLFLPGFRIEDQDYHIDGGIWANNPVLIGITEAIRYYEQSIENLQVLSVGTGTKAFSMDVSKGLNFGKIGWVREERIVNVVSDAQSQSAFYTAKLLLKPEQYHRVDATLPAAIPMDNYKRALPLIEMADQQGRLKKNEIENVFLSELAQRTSKPI